MMFCVFNVISYMQLGACFAMYSVIFARPHTSGLTEVDLERHRRSNIALSRINPKIYMNVRINDHRPLKHENAPISESAGLLTTEHIVNRNQVLNALDKKEFGSNTNHAADKRSKLPLSTTNATRRLMEQARSRVGVTAVSHIGKPIPVLNMSTASEKVSHTTTTSLVAALVFGVVFLIAVAVQIGKPWWESMLTNRDGYSRITFLMNGK